MPMEPCGALCREYIRNCPSAISSQPQENLPVFLSGGTYTEKFFCSAPHKFQPPGKYALFLQWRGIYKKILPPCPLISSQTQENMLFFPVTGHIQKKCPSRSTFLWQAGHRKIIFLYMPPNSPKIGKTGGYRGIWGTAEQFFCICPIKPETGMKSLSFCIRLCFSASALSVHRLFLLCGKQIHPVRQAVGHYGAACPMAL